MVEVSKYDLEILRKDGELVLYRGKSKDAQSQAAFASYGAPSDLGRDAVSVFGRDEASRSRVLVLSFVDQRPSPERLKRLENEYSLKDELDPSWATRPIGVATHWDRMVLVLQDPGGVPLDYLLRPAPPPIRIPAGNRWTSPWYCVWRLASRLRLVLFISEGLFIRTSSPPMFLQTRRLANAG